MSWPGVKTWTAGAWSFGDANTYIRDAMTSLRRYQNSLRSFVDAGLSLTNAFPGTAQVVHSGLLSSTPDEAYDMDYLFVGHVTAVTGPPANIVIKTEDETNADISAITGGVTILAAAVGALLVASGTVSKAASTSGGIQVFLKTNTGTATVTGITTVSFRPQV